eukprot:COSAG02_NODE_688_length_18473_cov_77.428105_11_plen_215_part_00
MLGEESLDERLDKCEDLIGGLTRLTQEQREDLVEDLLDLIVDLEVVRVPLWASMYDEAGCRLLELLPQHSDVRPDKPVGFGSHRGASKSRRTTHHMAGTGAGSAARNFSLHVDPEQTQPVRQNAAEHRAVVSMVSKNSRRQRHRHRHAGGKQDPRRRARTTPVASSGDEGPSTVRSRRGSSSSRAAGVGSLMDKSLFQFLQQSDLVGCEQKLKR